MSIMVNTFLEGVVDGSSLLDQGDLAVALLGLVEAYNTLLLHPDDFVRLAHTATGLELKTAIATLEIPDQARLLGIFRRSLLTPVGRLKPLPVPAKPVTGATPLFTVTEPPDTDPLPTECGVDFEAVEKRKLKTWLIKGTFFLFAPIPCILVGATVAISYKSGALPDSVLASGIMSTATEIVKLIFGAV